MRAEWPKYDIFLLYAGIEKGDDTDENMERRVLEVIDGSAVDAVVCLALDHVYDAQGHPRLDRTDFWVHNDYVLHLREKRPDKVLFGASVHPFRNDFKERVAECVEQGAVFMKWLPSSQQFSLADPTVREALKFLATAKNGKPLPLLLHTGVEYAVPTTNERTRSYDYLSWGWWDRFWNFWRFGKRWYTPDIKGVRQTLNEALGEGAVIIMAHCGLPYFVGRLLRWLEHDDFPVVRKYLRRTAAGAFGNGKCYADVSACATPFRKDYYGEISKLPENLLLFGSDFPTPVFELSADPEEVWRDFTISSPTIPCSQTSIGTFSYRAGLSSHNSRRHAMAGKSAIEKALDKALTKAKAASKPLDLATARYVVFSDQHKGQRDGADDFARCEWAYIGALKYYDREGYTLVVLGDVEELWECRPKPVMRSYGNIMELERRFHPERYLRAYGNHDDEWESPKRVRKHLWRFFSDLEVSEGFCFDVQDGGSDLGALFMVHGHQGEFFSDRLAGIAKFVVRRRCTTGPQSKMGSS
jgi:predicted TIM-barrel fold metal-dependent hydrolase